MSFWKPTVWKVTVASMFLIVLLVLNEGYIFNWDFNDFDSGSLAYFLIHELIPLLFFPLYILQSIWFAFNWFTIIVIGSPISYFYACVLIRVSKWCFQPLKH